ncbi:MAG: hypothetical protein K6U74_19885 [Firmicutes bacterium]|nr:hypothetical protein [Bacillota bacterium]
MVQKLVHAVYEQDSKGFWELLSERGKSAFAGESEAVPALAPVIKKKWNCPVERVTVLAAD